MQDGRSLRGLALGLGIFLAAGGLLGLGVYVAGAFGIFIRQPGDRSWLYWGLAIALIGMTLLIGGIALIYAWHVLGKEPEEPGAKQG